MTNKVTVIKTEEGIELRSTDFEALQEEKLKFVDSPYVEDEWQVIESRQEVHRKVEGDVVESTILLKKYND